MKKINVLWLIEHVAREMDVACLAKHILESKYGLNVKIAHYYLHTKYLLNNFNPDVVVHPFFYYLNGALATEDYVKRWPLATHFNVSWEQIFYEAHNVLKAPFGNFVKNKVIHHAWGVWYKNYLREHGVLENNIIVNGSPILKLYDLPYRNYYKTRKMLADIYSLNENKKWIFIPENYRWAFFSDKKLEKLVRPGLSLGELKDLRVFCKKSLIKILQWSNEIALQQNVEVIFRPRPSTNTKFILEVIHAQGLRLNESFHIIKQESVREWILASNYVISSLSTCLIEAAYVGKKIGIVEPYPIPHLLFYKWTDLVTKITKKEEFNKFFDEALECNPSDKLKLWAKKEMVLNDDPIKNLAEIVFDLYNKKMSKKNKILTKLTYRISNLTGKFLKYKKNYFNSITHENDEFTEKELDGKISMWSEILK